MVSIVASPRSRIIRPRCSPPRDPNSRVDTIIMAEKSTSTYQSLLRKISMKVYRAMPRTLRMEGLQKKRLEASFRPGPLGPLDQAGQSTLVKDSHPMTEFFRLRDDVRRKENRFAFLI